MGAFHGRLWQGYHDYSYISFTKWILIIIHINRHARPYVAFSLPQYKAVPIFARALNAMDLDWISGGIFSSVVSFLGRKICARIGRVKAVHARRLSKREIC
jgi:hypothetical protein